MNVSKIIWAPLKKSPNCASQMGNNFGVSQLIPYSNYERVRKYHMVLSNVQLTPRTATSLREPGRAA